MGRQPCCDKVGLKKGPWTAEEDKKLINFILTTGQCCWRAVPKLAGLLRCGKSCRLRWTNYLRPDLKRGLLSEYEEKTVIDLHAQLGNRWSKIASHFPGRTDNEIKNHWNTHIKKKLRKIGIDPVTHQPLPTSTTDTAADQSQEPPETQQKTESNEIETSFQSTITEGDSKELEQGKAMAIAMVSPLEVNNGFCTDEVPMIEPHEILVPCGPSSSSSSSSFSLDVGSSNNFLEDLEFMPDILDFAKSMGFWVNDLSSLDMLLNGDTDSVRNLTVEVEALVTEKASTVLDEESWKCLLS